MSLKESFEIKQQRSFYIAIRNDLIEKSENIFNTSENKALLFALAKIKPDQKYDYENPKNNLIEFSIKDYCDVMRLNYNSGKNYEIIKNAFLKLGTPFWANKDHKTETMVRWVDSVDHDKVSNTIKLTFSNKIAPFIYELSKNTPYTKMRLFYQIALKSKFSFKIYQLCQRFSYKGSYVISLYDLKEMLNLQKKIEDYYTFKKKVLEVVKNEINNITDINIDFEEIKENKKVVSIKFIIFKKTKEELNEVKKKYYNLINNIQNINQGKLDKKGENNVFDIVYNEKR